GTTSNIEYVSKAGQDGAQLAGKRNRLVLEARRARVARRKPVVSATPTRRLARLLLRRAPAYRSSIAGVTGSGDLAPGELCRRHEVPRWRRAGCGRDDRGR